MKIEGKILIVIFGICLFQTVSAQTPKHILEDFTLFWSDEFNGEYIDTNKWDYRDAGKQRVHGLVSEENSYLDKEGYLIIEVTKHDSIYQIGQIGTQNKFMTRFGYFECRSKMNKKLGPHVAFWLQSPTVQKTNNNPKDNGTEIDIFEYHINKGTNNIHHNLHWNGYDKEHHRHSGTTIQIDSIDSGFHVFGLEWNEKEYIFYVDGVETWRTTDAVSHTAEYIILSAELTGWGGDFSKSIFPDRVIFDYVRVYKKKK